MKSICAWLLFLFSAGALVFAASGQTSGEWAERMPAILELLKGPAFHGANLRSPSFRRVGVLKRSGLPVALVDVGSGYGAMNDGLAVFAVFRGRVIAPSFRLSNGIVERDGTVFPEGASAMHSEWVVIDESDDAIVSKTASMSPDGRRVASCEVHAYRWDGRREMFADDVSLARMLQKAGCVR